MSVLKPYWRPCPACKSTGKRLQKQSKQARLAYRTALEMYENKEMSTKPTAPAAHYNSCKKCNGSGLQPSDVPVSPSKDWPMVAIIGAGIGGVALAVALSHRGIPFKLYEKDINFNARSQGYGLTLQQASKAMKGFGIQQLDQGIVSTKHMVHNTRGDIIAEWGMRKWQSQTQKNKQGQTNVHIARQHLRRALVEELEKTHPIQWAQEFKGCKQNKDQSFTIEFDKSNIVKSTKANIVVGADGIRSKVRGHFMGDQPQTLNYLGTIVILGICAYQKLEDTCSDLLDGATVFQTANGNERIYVMPFDNKHLMWQLSFPLKESQALDLSRAGAIALKAESKKRVPWHAPIPQIIDKTPVSNISGYPVYDRPLWQPPAIDQKQVTLIGDAAHPMSPFKGQGANQALLDALELARTLYKHGNSKNTKTNDVIKNALTRFENHMMQRAAPKVKESARAARILHTEEVLKVKNAPRGK